MSELPVGWLRTTLGEVVEYGNVERIEPSQIPSSAWILELADIEKDTSRLLERFTLAERESKSTKNRFRKGDVLYGKLRPYLNKVLVADQDGFCTTEIIPIEPNEAIEGRYLFYWLRNPEFLSYVNSVSYGLRMPRLGTRDGKNSPLILAPYSEQKRIAEKLDTLLGRVEICHAHLNRIPQLMERLKQSVLAEATTGRLTEIWREERNIDVEWQGADVQSVAEVGTGSTPLRSNLDFYSEEGTPWIKSAATSDPLITAADEFVTEEAIRTHRLKLYPIGTLIVAMYGEGKTRGQVSELAIEATINQACAAIVVDETKVNKKFLKIVLQANYLEMRAMAEGGNQPNLNLSKIKQFRFLLPPSIEEQHEIVRQTELLFGFVDRLESRWRLAKTQTDLLIPSILAKAFRGELAEQDAGDEPAEKLLERITRARDEQVKKPKRKMRKTNNE